MIRAPLLTSRFCIAFGIVAVVCVANLPYLSIDMLWHDDGQWYFRATEGSILDLEWRGKITALSPYLDLVYAHGMTIAGVPATRALFVIVMALGSLGMYAVYRHLGFSVAVAFTAAILPNVLPSLRGIPVGLNASYALWGIAPMAAALVCLHKYFLLCSPHHHADVTQSATPVAVQPDAWAYLVGAFLLFYLALNLPGQPSSNFLIPNFLLFFGLFITTQTRRTLLTAIPFGALAAWMFYKQVQHSHIEPTNVPLSVIIDRAKQFIEMSSFVWFNTPYTRAIAYTLGGLGLVVLMGYPRLVAQPPRPFANKGFLYRAFLCAWTLGWIAANSSAYLAASSQFRPYDYAYVFNFGMVLLQVIGLFGMIGLCVIVVRAAKWKSIICMVAGLCLVAYVATIRWQYALHPWGWKAHYQRTTIEIRNNLTHRNIPNRGQVLVLGDNLGIFYNRGLHLANSGFMRYILDRRDVTSLIGPDMFPIDVFAPWEGWFTHMRGFDPQLPIAAFRRVPGGKLNRVDLLLQTYPAEQEQPPRLEWKLYDISPETAERANEPVQLATGKGLSAYALYMDNELPSRFANADVAFAPPPHSDRILSAVEARAYLNSRPSMLDAPVNAGKHLSIHHLSYEQVSTPGKPKVSLRILLKKTTESPPKFRLSYRLGKLATPSPLWSYAHVDDYLLISTPPMLASTFDNGVELELLDGGTHPHVLQQITNHSGEPIQIRLSPPTIADTHPLAGGSQ